MKKITLITVLALIGFLTSCKEPELVSIWMDYQETKCADKWGTGEGSLSSEVEDAVLNYFDGLSIEILDYDSEMDLEQGEDCEACSCKTGRTIRLQIEDNNQVALEEAGFSLE